MNIVIPVIYNGKSGSIEITLLQDGSRSINVNVEGYTMNMVQNGEIHQILTGTVQGKLYKVMEEKKVGFKQWRVRDFVITINTSRGEQKRRMQACGTAVDDLSKLPLGALIMCETSFLGKEFTKNEGGTTTSVYANLDEVSKIYQI